VTDAGILLQSSRAKILIDGPNIKILAGGIVTIQRSQVSIN
jgi:hypothetical protein